MKSVYSLILMDLKWKINAHRYFQMNHFKNQRQNMDAEIMSYLLRNSDK